MVFLFDGVKESEAILRIKKEVHDSEKVKNHYWSRL